MIVLLSTMKIVQLTLSNFLEIKMIRMNSSRASRYNPKLRLKCKRDWAWLDNYNGIQHSVYFYCIQPKHYSSVFFISNPLKVTNIFSWGQFPNSQLLNIIKFFCNGIFTHLYQKTTLLTKIGVFSHKMMIFLSIFT